MLLLLAAHRIPFHLLVLTLTLWTGRKENTKSPRPKAHLAVSRDGTAIHTHIVPNGHHRESSLENLWYFPDPDASWGWDNARGCDSVSFLVAFHELEKHIPSLFIENMCQVSIIDNPPPTASSRIDRYGLLSIRTTSAEGSRFREPTNLFLS